MIISAVFGLLAIAFWLNVFFFIYHLVRFGIGFWPRLLALVILAGSVITFALVVITFEQVDWSLIIAGFQRSLTMPTFKL